MCEVSNGVGKSLEARATLTIHTRPQVSVKVVPHEGHPIDQSQTQQEVTQLSLRRHSQVSLACTGSGTVPLSVLWYKNGREVSLYDSTSVTASSSFRLFESTSSKSTDSSKQYGERVTSLMLKHVTRADTAQYVCVARNSMGATHRAIVLHVLESPDAPEGLKAIEVGSRTVTLTWAVGYTGNLPLLSQNIEYKKESGKCSERARPEV